LLVEEQRVGSRCSAFRACTGARWIRSPGNPNFPPIKEKPSRRMQMPDKIDVETGMVAEHSRVLEASNF